MSLHPNQVLLAPVVTEKGYELIDQSKYSFRVHPDAHKTQIRQAVEELFDVHVERVNIVKVQPKPKRRGLVRGKKPGWKKAIVQVRKGESIEIFEGASSGSPATVRPLARDLRRSAASSVAPMRKAWALPASLRCLQLAPQSAKPSPGEH